MEIITGDEPAGSGSAPAAADGSIATPESGQPVHQKANGKQGSQHADGMVPAAGAAHEAGAKAAHRQQHKKRKHQEQRWSSLSAEDHAWFLARQGACRCRSAELRAFVLLSSQCCSTLLRAGCLWMTADMRHNCAFALRSANCCRQGPGGAGGAGVRGTGGACGAGAGGCAHGAAGGGRPLLRQVPLCRPPLAAADGGAPRRFSTS